MSTKRLNGGMLRDKLMENVDRRGDSECWPWTGGLNKGYGGIWATRQNGKRYAIPAHRVAYELAVGPIPQGMVIDHLCRNRACCNPAHLEVVTNEENIRRGSWSPIVNARKTRCFAGHPYDAANTYVTSRGARQCRKCKARRERDRKAAARSAA